MPAADQCLEMINSDGAEIAWIPDYYSECEGE